jgi:thiol-disulfide isomerase/thioredoxin
MNVSVSAQISFFEGNWSDALLLAEKENKKIFVYFYAVWCAPCKSMSQNTFTDKSAADYYNNHFINIKIDAEHEQSEALKKVNIQAYPTLAYFNTDGTLFYLTMGAYTPQNFIQIGKNVIDYKKNMEICNNENNNPVALYNYLQILYFSDTAQAINRAEKYLYSLKNQEYILSENWAVIYSFGRNPYSPWFNYIINDITQFLNEYREAFYDYFTQTSGLILKKAIYEKNYQLTETYKQIARKANKQLTGIEYPGMDDEVDMHYFFETGDLPNYLKTTDRWLNTYHSENIQTLTERSIEIAEKYPDNTLVMEYALKWSMKALALENSFYTNLILSHIYRYNRQYNQALNYADVAISKAGALDDVEYAKTYRQEIIAIIDKK